MVCLHLTCQQAAPFPAMRGAHINPVPVPAAAARSGARCCCAAVALSAPRTHSLICWPRVCLLCLHSSLLFGCVIRFFGWHGAMPQCWTLPGDCTRLCLCTVLAYNAVRSCALPAGTDFDDISDSCADGECRDVDAEPAAAGRQPRLTGYCHSGMGRAALFLGRKFGTLLREVCVGAGWRITTAGHSLGAGELRIERWMHSLADVVFDFVGWSRVKVPHQPASSHVGQCILPLFPRQAWLPC